MAIRNPRFSRRDFLKLAVLGAGALAFRPVVKTALPEFPQAERLGRITVGKMDVYARPDATGRVSGHCTRTPSSHGFAKPLARCRDASTSALWKHLMDLSGAGMSNLC
ncbi:MAG: twin-arginine translocation signal domain-containing protein [Chloroflexi bacterium]|nr:twin-arginine translocation signal domain-containing protein [Chloroflexota bacterium]